MAVKSVVDIDVDDAKFKRFSETFSKYQDALKKSPEIWRNINKSSSHTADTFLGISAALLSLNALHKEENETARKGTQTLERHVSLWTKIHRSTTGVLRDVGGIAKFLIGGGVALGLTGFGFGLAGLFGIRDIAKDVSASRNFALGNAMTIGQRHAFEKNQGRYLSNPDEFLRSSFAATGVGTPQNALADIMGVKLGGGTYKVADRMLMAIQALAKRTPASLVPQLATMYPQLSAFGIGTSQLETLRNISRGELSKEILTGTQFAKQFAMSDRQGRGFQDFTSALSNTFHTMWTNLAKDITPLLNPLQRLIGTFGRDVDLLLKGGVAKAGIASLSKGLDDFSRYLASGQFTKAIQDFGNDVHDFATVMHDTGKVLGFLSWPLRKSAKGWWNVGEWLGVGTHNLLQYGISTYENDKYDANLNAIAAANASSLHRSVYMPNTPIHVNVHTVHMVKVTTPPGGNVVNVVNQLHGGVN